MVYILICIFTDRLLFYFWILFFKPHNENVLRQNISNFLPPFLKKDVKNDEMVTFSVWTLDVAKRAFKVKTRTSIVLYMRALHVQNTDEIIDVRIKLN